MEFDRFRSVQRLTGELERVKGIEPSYSAWKGTAKPNDLKSGSEKYAAKTGRNSRSFRTRATATVRPRHPRRRTIDDLRSWRGWRAAQDKTADARGKAPQPTGARPRPDFINECNCTLCSESGRPRPPYHAKLQVRRRFPLHRHAGRLLSQSRMAQTCFGQSISKGTQSI